MKKIMVLISVLILSGCASVPSANFESRLKLGMTREQVRAVMGRPMEVSKGLGSFEHWTYPGGWCHAEPRFQFEGGRLVNYEITRESTLGCPDPSK